MVAIKLQKEENRKAFLDVFPTLAEEVLAELRKYNMPEDAYNWTKQVLFSSSRFPIAQESDMSFALFSTLLESGIQRSWW